MLLCRLVRFDCNGMFFVVGFLFLGSGFMFFCSLILGEWVKAVECGGIGFRCKGFVLLIYCFVLPVVLGVGKMCYQCFQTPLGFFDVIGDGFQPFVFLNNGIGKIFYIGDIVLL